VLSHMTQNPRLNSFLSRSDTGELRQAYQALGGQATTPRSVGSELTDVLLSQSHRTKLDRLLDGPYASDAEYWIGERIGNLPPLFFYLDGLDEEYRHAPQHWLHCQEGLFHQTMRLTRDARLGGRLRVVVALRDTVYSSVTRTEHATRYVDSPYITQLRWTSKLATRFLEAKVRQLAPDMLCKPADTPQIADWLGRDTIRDPISKARAPVHSYLVGHTRALPRDVVLMGNTLCRAVDRARETERFPSEAMIVEAVEYGGRVLGLEQLAILANQVATAAPTSGIPAEEYVTTYGEGGLYSDAIRSRLSVLLSPYGLRGQVSRSELQRLAKKLNTEFGLDIDLTAILWENDSLGVATTGHVRYRYELSGDLSMPMSARTYTLHPILRAALA
jgi:hypothetical protein